MTQIIRDLQNELREMTAARDRYRAGLFVALMRNGPVQFDRHDHSAALAGRLEESFPDQGNVRWRWLPPASSDLSSAYSSELED